MEEETLDHALIYAARKGEYEQVQSLLQQGASPNFRLSNGTALHDAIRNAYVDVCQLLLDKGASCDVAANFLQFHALDIAIVESARNDADGKAIFDLIFSRQTSIFFASAQRMKFSFWLACSESHCQPFDALLPVLPQQIFNGINRQQSLFNAAALGYNFHIVIKLVRYGIQLPAAFRPPQQTNKSNSIIRRFRRSCHRLFAELRGPSISLQSLCRRTILKHLPIGLEARHKAIFERLELPVPVKRFLDFADFDVSIRQGRCGCFEDNDGTGQQNGDNTELYYFDDE